MDFSLQHVTFVTQDELRLPGLFFQPTTPTKRAVIFLHGCGSASVFYKQEKLQLFAQALARNNWAFLAFNNRGAHYLKKFSFGEGEDKQDRLYGTATEVIAETVPDIDAAVAWLESQGIEEIILLGESTGANKICVYHHYRPDNSVLGYILVGGGDDTGLWWQNLGENAKALYQEAQKRVAAADDSQYHLLTADLRYGVMTYRGLYDVMNPDGDYNTFPFAEQQGMGQHRSTRPLFTYFRQIDKPTLLLYGSEDPFTFGPPVQAVKTLQQVHPQPDLLTTQVVEGSDHSFHGTEEAEVSAVTSWLRQVFP